MKVIMSIVAAVTFKFSLSEGIVYGKGLTYEEGPDHGADATETTYTANETCIVGYIDHDSDPDGVVVIQHFHASSEEEQTRMTAAFGAATAEAGYSDVRWAHGDLGAIRNAVHDAAQGLDAADKAIRRQVAKRINSVLGKLRSREAQELLLSVRESILSDEETAAVGPTLAGALWKACGHIARLENVQYVFRKRAKEEARRRKHATSGHLLLKEGAPADATDAQVAEARERGNALVASLMELPVPTA